MPTKKKKTKNSVAFDINLRTYGIVVNVTISPYLYIRMYVGHSTAFNDEYNQ